MGREACARDSSSEDYCYRRFDQQVFVKDEIRTLLEREHIAVRATPKSFNTDIGVPLSILGISSGYGRYRAWAPIFCSVGLRGVPRFFRRHLVLEFGVCRIAGICNISLDCSSGCRCTDRSDESICRAFPGVDALVREYQLLVRRMKRDGFLVQRRLGETARSVEGVLGNTRFIWALGRVRLAGEVRRVATGEAFAVWHDGVCIRNAHIDRFGEHHVFARLAGVAVREYAQHLC